MKASSSGGAQAAATAGGALALSMGLVWATVLYNAIL